MLARLALGNVRKSLADFGIYFLTVMLGVAVFYAPNNGSLFLRTWRSPRPIY